MSDKVIENITTNTRVAAIQCIYSVIFMGEKLSGKMMRYFKNKSFLYNLPSFVKSNLFFPSDIISELLERI